jgi:hypothetical protein
LFVLHHNESDLFEIEKIQTLFCQIMMTVCSIVASMGQTDAPQPGFLPAMAGRRPDVC